MKDLPGPAAEYVASLGMGSHLDERLRAIYDLWAQLCPADIEELFISEYLTEEGQRQYESVWFVAPGYVMEGNFVSSDRSDIVPMDENIQRIEIDRRDFDLTEAKDSSRLTVEIMFSGGAMGGIGGTLKASGANCIKLRDVLQRYLIPNLGIVE